MEVSNLVDEQQELLQALPLLQWYNESRSKKEYYAVTAAIACLNFAECNNNW